MRTIETQAMVNSGVSQSYAANAVNKAIQDLIRKGVTAPTRIPWN